MATKESVHRKLLARAENWRDVYQVEKAMEHQDHLARVRAFNRAEAYEEAAKLVSEIDSFEQETPNDL